MGHYDFCYDREWEESERLKNKKVKDNRDRLKTIVDKSVKDFGINMTLAMIANGEIK